MTTILARIYLNRLRTRRGQREEPLEERLPDPVISSDAELRPEDEAPLADPIGLALLVVLDALTPAERLAFVLHDVFQLPFEETPTVVGRIPATRQLASRARRRVREAALRTPDPDRSRRREVVEALFVAARRGDLDALVALLDPEVVLWPDFGVRRLSVPSVIRGATAVAGQAPLVRAVAGGDRARSGLPSSTRSGSHVSSATPTASCSAWPTVASPLSPRAGSPRVWSGSTRPWPRPPASQITADGGQVFCAVLLAAGGRPA